MGGGGGGSLAPSWQSSGVEYNRSGAPCHYPLPRGRLAGPRARQNWGKRAARLQKWPVRKADDNEFYDILNKVREICECIYHNIRTVSSSSCVVGSHLFVYLKLLRIN